jgi:hypothetical protein
MNSKCNQIRLFHRPVAALGTHEKLISAFILECNPVSRRGIASNVRHRALTSRVKH